MMVLVLILTGCGASNVSNQQTDTRTEEKQITADTEQETNLAEDEEPDNTPYEYKAEFDKLDDAELMTYVEDSIYDELVNSLDGDKYYVQNVSTAYVSQEYIDELAYNSKTNVFFGYSLDEVDAQFEGKRYVFTLDENNKTTVEEFEEYDDTYEKAIKKVAVGTGVILVCVTVSVVTGGVGAPAVSMVFATAAQSGTVMALSSGALGGVASGIVTGVKTGDMDQALKAAAEAGSDGFMWGAIGGSVAGGVTEGLALKGATLNGLTMDEAAIIQKESKYPLEVIGEFHSAEEYAVFRDAGLKTKMINGKSALVRSDIDLNLVDDMGRTNLERMKQGLSAIDANGQPFELHHVGQNAEGTLAILTQTEHDNAVLHGFKEVSEINRKAFAKQRKTLWKTMAKLLEAGEI